MTRRRRPRREPGDSFEQLPFQQFRNPFPPMEILESEGGVPLQ